MSNFQKSDSSISSQTLPCDGQKAGKFYSLIPDLITGWKPKNMSIPAPILIKYRSPLVTQVLKYYRNEQYRIVYIGPRHPNSFSFHQHTPHDYNVRHLIGTEQLPRHIRRQLAFETDSRPFQGMNTSANCPLTFQSSFESGNLDIVVRMKDKQYNLFLRPDTNTCGHMQWFYFRVTNSQKCKVRFNICNNRKAKTLFQRGMRPFVLSKKSKEEYGKSWQQAGQGLKYSKLQMKDVEDKVINGETIKIGDFQGYYQLSFEYNFQYDNDEVYFAYCPPYTYSHLKKVIFDLKKNYNCFCIHQIYSETIMSESKLCNSLSGLELPLLTITDPMISDQEKTCVLAIGRLHPGQSNGSFAIEGLINFLLSQEARILRKQTVFKIVPMVNPDGVVFGNYRTSLSGKDLNRQFRNKKHELTPEVAALKDLTLRLKNQFKQKAMYFLDFHGHSVKKNVFCYGPEYDIWSLKYQKARVLPKILAGRTEIFRMKSCLFKVANFKKATARAYMLAFIPYCYTIESSVGLFRDGRQVDHPFTIKKWEQIGYIIGDSLAEIFAKLAEATFNALKRKQKRIKKDESHILLDVSKQRDEQAELKAIQNHPMKVNSVKYLNPIRNLRKRPHGEQKTQEIVKIQEQQCESDGFSEGNSDCQSEQNDFPKIEYDRLKQKIVNLIDNFQVQILGHRKLGNIPKKQQRIMKVKKGRESLIRKKTTQQMLLVPSLKHRLDKIVLSEKKISFLNGVNLIDASYHPKVRRYDRNTSPANQF